MDHDQVRFSRALDKEEVDEMSEQVKGSLDSYLKALEDELERAKHQRMIAARGTHGGIRSWEVVEDEVSQVKWWDMYIEHLENLSAEAVLLVDFEVDESET